ncbi:MAG: virulence RhuM family protein [Kistimonas sp.]|nr:virulence RhuM family protein [Kistimonas sp.]
MPTPNDIAIFESQQGDIEVRLARDTVWLNQAQMISLFERDQSVISRHINNVFREGELERESNMQKMHIGGSDKPVALYSLDVVISVGYRVKAQQGVRFRQWATRTLKAHLTQGYTLNQQRFEDNARELEAALTLIRKAAASPQLQAGTGQQFTAGSACLPSPAYKNETGSSRFCTVVCSLFLPSAANTVTAAFDASHTHLLLQHRPHFPNKSLCIHRIQKFTQQNLQ